MKCEHGVEGCIHLGHEHDEDSCFNGWWTHDYICQECGHEMKSQKHSLKSVNRQYVAPEFPAKNCPKCKSEKSLV
jgi:hypothetical protein